MAKRRPTRKPPVKKIKGKDFTSTAVATSAPAIADAQVVFYHPRVSPPNLTLWTKPDQIVWSYGLNTANFPTYGGEVVQILSMYFDDIQVGGTVATYEEIETIYGWFINYIQLATAGHGGHGSYNTEPVTFRYPHRGWEFQIYPKMLPSFKYGRDVVAPTWQLSAAISEPDSNPSMQEVQDHILTEKAFNQQHTGEFDPFGKATAYIGYNDDNPWSGPTEKDQTAVQSAYDNISQQYNNYVSSWAQGDLSSLSISYSKPAFLNRNATTDPPGLNSPSPSRLDSTTTPPKNP